VARAGQARAVTEDSEFQGYSRNTLEISHVYCGPAGLEGQNFVVYQRALFALLPGVLRAMELRRHGGLPPLGACRGRWAMRGRLQLRRGASCASQAVKSRRDPDIW
jgi:hypothetical protein